MKHKLTAILFATLICTLCVFGFTACEKCEHEFGEWTVITAPTCTQKGKQSHTCTKCGRTEKESISALGHEFSQNWTTDENKHWLVCTREGCEAKSNEGEHSEAVHNCYVCGLKTSEHEFSQEWTLNGNKHWHACTHEGCAVKSEEAAHVYGEVTYSWTDDFSACTASGTCNQCEGYVSETADSTLSDYTYSVSFTKGFSSQTYDLTDLTNMTAAQQENALGIIFANKPTKLTLTLPEDFNSFSLINDPIKLYGEDNYIDLTLKGVKKIPTQAFSWNGNLASITISKSVTSIETAAFYRCFMLDAVYYEGELSDWLKINVNSGYLSGSTANLFIDGTLVKNIEIPDGITEIGSHFSGCTTLESVTIGKDVTTIGNSAFAGCTSLDNLVIPSSVTSIGKGAFSGCSALKSITLSSSLTTIGNSAFVEPRTNTF